MLIHLYNQGNNRHPIFFKRDNYLFFLKKVRTHIYPHCDILAWCLMPNHFHFLLWFESNAPPRTRATAPSGGTDENRGTDETQGKPTRATAQTRATAPSGGTDETGITAFSNNLRIMLSSYTQAINKQEGRTGSLFRQNSKMKDLSKTDARATSKNQNTRADYAFNCFQYIHQNPMNAGLVDKMEDWEFSSFRDYLSIRNGKLVNKEIAYKIVNYDKDDFYAQSYTIVDEKGLF